MELTRENISKSYYKFVNDQVLTADKLNNLITHVDVQDRLSRVFLSGIGIVCGFKLSFNNDKITITQGVGITSDGDLIQLKTDNDEGEADVLVPDKIEFTHYKEFLDSNANYGFFKAGNGDGKIKMWELFQAEVDKSFLLKDVSPQNNDDGLSSLTDKVVLLYLEAYSDKGDLCTAIDCDSQGEEQVAKLRVLLISEANAEKIVKKEKDPVFFWHDITEKYTSLPEIKPLRVILNNTDDLDSIRKSFFDAIDKTVLKKLIESFETIFEIFHKDSITASITEKLIFTEDQFKKLIDFQYKYDLLSDMIATFNEIKKLLLQINSECSPNVSSFPKHLLLGKLFEQNIYDTYRHRVYKSPMSKDESFNRKKVESLIGRAEHLIKSYDYQNKVTIEDIIITPSINGDTTLGNRAIPYYYLVEIDFLNFWSFEKTTHLKQDYNLSYHIEKLANKQEIRQPLLFSSNEFDFLRIEGLLGLKATECLAKIDKDIITYGLDFDCIMLDLDNKEQSFKDFVQKHPSLIHRAGVPKGGTFVIVSENEITIADFCLSYKITQEQKKGCAYPFIWPFQNQKVAQRR